MTALPSTSPSFSRRQFLLALGGLAAAAAWPTAAAVPTRQTLSAAYTAWKRAFVQSDGRVTDPGQDGISTSEGQGYGMLLALAAGDVAGFEGMWAWTQKQLAIRDDGLFAWRWTPGQGVTDKNNAADSDVLIAWALARASRRRPALADVARQLATIIRTKLLRDTPWGTVLLPAVEGFDTPQGQVVNLSYWVFPALPELARIDPSPQWEALRTSGLKLLSIARFGRWGLPPDWLLLRDPLSPDPMRPPRYGFDAVRIPLYLTWAGLTTPQLIAPFKAFWNSFRCEDFLPAWTNLADDSIDSFGASPGMKAIRDWVKTGRPPVINLSALSESGYYSATLAMLTQVAARQAPAVARW